MSVNSITSHLQAALKEATFNHLSFSGGSGFSDNLTVGQVLKGRVLRHYEGNRYLVDFGGEQKVVDSVVPLRTQELISGKVIAVGERVELRRLAADVPAEKGTAQAVADHWPLGGKYERLVDRVFERYLGTLSASERGNLLRAVREAPQPETMALAGLALTKIGIALAPEALRAVFEALTQPAKQGLFPPAGEAPELATTEGAGRAKTQAAVDALAPLIAELVDDIPERRAAPRDVDIAEGDVAADIQLPTPGGNQAADNGTGRQGLFNMARWILNAQSGGSVSHRIGTIPIKLGDQLIEVNVAVFDQRRAQVAKGMQHRQILFSLHTEALGNVEVLAKIAGRHVRVEVTSENAAATEEMSRYVGELQGALRETGWEVDELVYETRIESAPANLARAVVEHLVRQDSLNRLM
jgi:hypothetical protein